MTPIVRALAVLCVVASIGCSQAVIKPPDPAALLPVATTDTSLLRILHESIGHGWTLRIMTTDSVPVTARAVDLTRTTLILVGRRIPIAEIRSVDERRSTSASLVGGALAGAVGFGLIGWAISGDLAERPITAGDRLQGAIPFAALGGALGSLIIGGLAPAEYSFIPVWRAQSGEPPTGPVK